MTRKSPLCHLALGYVNPNLFGIKSGVCCSGRNCLSAHGQLIPYVFFLNCSNFSEFCFIDGKYTHIIQISRPCRPLEIREHLTDFSMCDYKHILETHGLLNKHVQFYVEEEYFDLCTGFIMYLFLNPTLRNQLPI